MGTLGVVLHQPVAEHDLRLEQAGEELDVEDFVAYRQGDEVVLTTYYEDPDARPASDVWDYLSTPPVMADEAPLKEATADRLTLERDAGPDPLWHLSEADRDRTRP